MIDVELRADCSRCVGLCCVAPAFGGSADFALDKAAGVQCPNLAGDDRCTIHDHLRDEGFAGCVAFDCFGAGQRVTRQVAGGRTSWRDGPAEAAALFAAFAVVRPLHELLRHLDEAARLARDPASVVAIATAAEEIDAAANLDVPALEAVDIDAHRDSVSPLLRQVSEQTRAGLPQAHVDLRGADLVGADLRGRALHGADLSGALALGADLSGADLRHACLLGTDLRGARLHGADLRDAIFLTGPQVASSIGDAHARLPEGLASPEHW